MKVIFTKDAVDKMEQMIGDRSGLGGLIAEIMRISEQFELWELRRNPNRRGNARAVIAVSNDLRAVMIEDTTDPDRVVVVSVYREGAPRPPASEADKSPNLENHSIV